jgi:hypothetical protein
VNYQLHLLEDHGTSAADPADFSAKLAALVAEFHAPQAPGSRRHRLLVALVV